MFGNFFSLPCCNASTNVDNTSWYIGSPAAPDSFVLSNTPIDFTEAGNTFIKCSKENGLYNRTVITPVFPPAAFNAFTVSATVSLPEPIMMVTCSASAAPVYSNSSYFLPCLLYTSDAADAED